MNKISNYVTDAIIINHYEESNMSLAPIEYDFGNETNYAFATTVTCANDEALKLFVEGYGHYLNYNHE